MTVNVVIVGEGQTEETFVRDVLAPELASHGVHAESRLIKTSKHGRGGGLNLDRVRFALRQVLLQRSDTYVTTLFDLYGLGPTFPGFAESRHSSPRSRAARIENLLADDVVTHARCRRDRFVPHVQPHEFEALLFSDIRRFGEVDAGWAVFESDLDRVRTAFETPEHINDSPLTAPSKRLASLLRPKYDKVRHGPALAHRIGLHKIRAACPHFDAWIHRLINLQPL
ncbi:DUF4276 family protein [Caballeronia sp. ATUFL_M2_KS44]|uniref:DUF4276 family protein n=1 Tax=Caballeronia sp. ATUFL_M2_KS44 TaxID=2921767 RepID=UPI002541B034|nr:DUF4276 family protein [Caballeronia sp. ATUFL_M2_KS44]